MSAAGALASELVETSDWPSRPLGDLVDVLDSKRKPITKRDRVAGPYPYYGATGILDHVDGYIFDEPLVLIGEDGAKWGAGDNSAFAIEGKAWVNNHAHVLRPHRETVLDDWLIYYLNAADLGEFISGMTVPKLNQGRLKEIPIPLPPLEEQKRIVAVLDQAFAALDRARANAETNLVDAEELFAAHVARLIQEPPADWEKVTLGNLAAVISGQHIAASDYNTEGRGIGYLTGPSDFGRNNPTVSKWTEHPKRTAEKDDILITVKGSGVGSVNLMTYDELAISRQLMAIRAKPIERDFLYFVLEASFEVFQGLANGAAIPGISRSDVLDFELALPPVSELQAVTSGLKALKGQSRNLADHYCKQTSELDDLRQSILQKAFAGELT